MGKVHQAIMMEKSTSAISDHAEQAAAATCGMFCVDWRKDLKTWAYALGICAVYLGVGAAVYASQEEDWSVVDAIYFGMVTMSTVGYGDLSPTTNFTYVYTIFNIFVGIIFVFPSISAAFTVLLDPPVTACQEKLEEWFPSEALDLDGDGETDLTMPRHPLLYYGKNMSPILVLVVMIQLISAAIFQSITGNTYGLCLYHCIVTATTVGYGDMALVTDDARIWAIFHIWISVGVLGDAISQFGDLQDSRNEQLLRIKQLTSQFDQELVGQLLELAVELRPNVQRDGRGLTELEFVVCMAIQLGMVELDDLRPFIRLFRNSDIDGNGRLSKADITRGLEMTEKQRAKFQCKYLDDVHKPRSVTEARSRTRRGSRQVSRRPTVDHSLGLVATPRSKSSSVVPAPNDVDWKVGAASATPSPSPSPKDPQSIASKMAEMSRLEANMEEAQEVVAINDQLPQTCNEYVDMSLSTNTMHQLIPQTQ